MMLARLEGKKMSYVMETMRNPEILGEIGKGIVIMVFEEELPVSFERPEYVALDLEMPEYVALQFENRFYQRCLR